MNELSEPASGILTSLTIDEIYAYFAYISKLHTYVGGLKSSYDDVISAADIFFEKWNSNAATPMEEVCGLPDGRYWKINLIW